MEQLNYLSYALLRCVDEQRDEALNVGVVVLDPAHHAVQVRVAGDLRRVSRTLPNVPVQHLQRYLETVPGFFENQATRLTPSTLEELAREWGNGLRLSAVRVAEGPDPAVVADRLFRSYVETAPEELPAVKEPEGAVAVMGASSRRVVGMVVSRLRKRGFAPRRDYEQDARVTGRTRSDHEVPVWFPLLVQKTRLIDAIEVKGRDERRSIDAARLIATKTYEVLRAQKTYQVDVVVRESDSSALNEIVHNVLADEGRVDGRAPGVHWRSELDRLVGSIPGGQLSAFDVDRH